MNYINPYAIEWGPFNVKWYALIIVTGVIVACYIGTKEANRLDFKKDTALDFVLYALPIGIIGARLFYVVFNLQYYLANPAQIIAIWEGGLAIYGGIIAGVVVAISFCYYRMLDFWKFADIWAPGLILAQAIGRWGNFTNHEAYGAITTQAALAKYHIPQFIIDNMYINGEYRIPTFFYESMWCLLGGVFILVYRHFKKQIVAGELALIYLIWYGCGRAVIEGMRTDSLMLTANIRISQALSVILVICAIIVLIVRYKSVNSKRYTRSTHV